MLCTSVHFCPPRCDGRVHRRQEAHPQKRRSNLLENIQNEVHRFAITFHRDKRSKSQVESALDNIAGIGEKRKSQLLQTFKSVARIKLATLEEIASVIGMKAAKNIKENL